MTSGIYKIVNLANERWYVGSAVNLERRRLWHFSQLRRAAHGNRHLQHSFDQWGEDAFRFDVLEHCPKEKLIEREQWYMDRLREQGVFLYNVNPTAGNCLGRKFSPETLAKMSAASRRRFDSPEERAKISAAQKGHAVSAETRAKMSAARRRRCEREAGKIVQRRMK